MVRQLTAILCEEVVTLLQGIYHIGKLHDVDTTNLSQLLHIFRELRLLNVHGLVWTPCRNHDRIVGSLVACILNMVVQVVNGIIGGTYTLHVVVLHQTTGRELGLLQLLVTLVKNLTGGLGAQLLFNAESGLQLQVCPVIQGVTEGVRHGLSPLLKLFPIAGILTGAVFLIYTVGTHGTPLVVVTTQPQLCDALKLMIVGHHLWNQVTVIVDNRHLSRMVVIQVLGYLSLQNEVLVIELFH